MKYSTHIVFDLDDTLYEEADYVESALNFAADMTQNAFGVSCDGAVLFQAWQAGQNDALGDFWGRHKLPQVALHQTIAAMRGHRPQLVMPEDSRVALEFAESHSLQFSILTDGRSITQRMKITALGLQSTKSIYISEERACKKPDRQAFEQIVRDQPEFKHFLYVADNPKKDFVTANEIGWCTAMLRSRGRNIHAQDVDLPKKFHAQHRIDKLSEVFDFLY